MKGGIRVTHDTVTNGSNVKINCTGYNALLVHHYITGAITGGFVSIAMSGRDDGNFIAHHGDGYNIKAADSVDSYTSLFKGIMDYVSVNLSVTDGTHTVTIQPINI